MHHPAKTYLEHRILSASPEQLQLLLYEGAIRFARWGRSALEERNYEKAQDSFERVVAILVELHAGLRPEVAPELCDKFAQLYNFCMRKVNEANFLHDVALLDEAIGILEHLRESWLMLLERVAEERAASAMDEPALARA